MTAISTDASYWFVKMISGVLTKERLQAVIAVGFLKRTAFLHRLDVPEVIVRIRQIPDAQIARCDSRIRQQPDAYGNFCVISASLNEAATNPSIPSTDPLNLIRSGIVKR